MLQYFTSYSNYYNSSSKTKNSVTQYIYIYSSSWKLMPEDDSKESKHVARIIMYVILK